MKTKHTIPDYQRTPGPWKYDATWALILGPKGEEVAAVHSGGGSDTRRPDWHTAWENAAFIIRACNAHDELIEACKAAQHLISEMGMAFDDVPAGIDAWVAQVRSKVKSALITAGQEGV